MIDNLINIERLGQILYTHYFLYFILASIILLIAMIGAILLTFNNINNIMRQHIIHQVSRNTNLNNIY